MAWITAAFGRASAINYPAIRLPILTLTRHRPTGTITPMYIFTRYVVTEILKIFFLTLTAITLLVTVGMGVKEGTNCGCPRSVILHLMPYMLPEMLVITIPVSLLLAVSIVYGRMTGSNEIVALKSLGISPMDVIWPTIVLTLIFSIGTLYLQEMAATWGRPNVARVVTESVEEIAYGMLQKKQSLAKCAGFSITVKDVDGEKCSSIRRSPSINRGARSTDHPPRRQGQVGNRSESQNA